MKHSRLAHLAVVQRKKREEKSVRERAERIAAALMPRVTAGEQYPLEVRDDSHFGLGVTLQLNARPERRDLLIHQHVRVPVGSDWRHIDETAHFQTFRMRAIEYALQRDQTRLRWYGWGPAEDIPSAEVRTCLHDVMHHVGALETWAHRLRQSLKGSADQRALLSMVGMISAAVDIKTDVLEALGASTQRWEHGKKVSGPL